ncbi:outer membrane beta-barrel protein [Aureivirga sp. CE67]|uniref:outer membrane beta-barrel protein n=1 Tax=Aureivirga sp. CE67 TaxID=1788983 RepID=UPI0018CBE481|nr:outer membrane beta-barrel protein [Aureivirga sp. CE67]
MKKLVIITLTLMMSLSAFAQDHKKIVGISGAIPLGNTSDVSKVGFGVDLGYLIEASDRFEVGFVSGISFFKGKEVDYIEESQTKKFKYSDAKYISLAGVFRYNLLDNVYIGTDLGYAIGIGKDVKNGLYYRPRLGLKLTEFVGLNASYTGLNVKGGTWKSMNLGVEFSL